MEIAAVLVDPSEKQSWFCATPATNPDFDCLCDWRRKKHPPLLVALADQGEGTVVEIELVDADARNFTTTKSAAEHQCDDCAVTGADRRVRIAPREKISGFVKGKRAPP